MSKTKPEAYSAEALVTLLRKVPLFAGLSEAALKAVSQLSRVETLSRGEVLIEQGDQSDSLYVVIRGRFLVQADDRLIAEIKEGEPIGELAFFTGEPRTATVTAGRNSNVLVFDRASYDKVISQTPQIATDLLAAISARLVKATKKAPTLRPQIPKSVVFMPIGNQAISSAFVEQLQTTIGGKLGWQVVTLLDAAETVRDDEAALDHWLQGVQEESENVVIIVDNPTENLPWYKAAIANGDNVFLVGKKVQSADDVPAVMGLERNIFADTLQANTQLVVVRDEYAEPIQNTKLLLAERPVALHHHVALDRVEDFERLSRFVRGKAIGLVMSGGGAFGTAHLGAIKAMQEQGYVFDMVGGTSIGAAMASVLALGMETSDAIEKCEQIFLKSKTMNRMTVPIYSVLDSVALDEQLKKHIGEVDIEDVPLNFFSVATSLSSNDVSVIRHGPLWKAVRASTSLPGVFPPLVTDDGEVLIDGGLLDNVPIDVMRYLKVGPNVVFNFKQLKDWRVKTAYEDLPGRWPLLAQTLRLSRKKRPRFPRIASILTRSMIVSARRLMDQTDTTGDVVIDLLPLQGMGFLEWKKGRRQFDVAYNDMVAKLAELHRDQTDLDEDERFALLQKIET
ncbi:MAG: patatin-like phospholipase family protein [Hyphomicrobiales bacterium]